MIRKLFFSVIVFVLSSVAMAKPQVCRYVDHLQAQGVAGLQILGIQSEGNVNGVITSQSTFNINDKQSTDRCDVTSSGTVTVMVGTDANNYCNLTIADGPFKYSDPAIISNLCVGNVHYVGIEQIPRLSYSYNLNFTH